MSGNHKYIVTYTVDFTRAKAVSAKNQEDAIRKVEEQERNFQETLKRSGYIIGDIDIIDASRDGEVSSRW
jgi:hypothetical protein